MTSPKRSKLWKDNVTYTIYVSKYKNAKSAYKTWFSNAYSANEFDPFENRLYVPSQVAMYWHGLNIGNGYRAKLVREYNKQVDTIARKVS
jgi:hypothetical protein